MTPEKALNKAIAIVGGQSQLARLLNTSPQVVQNWCYRKRVPASRCVFIEEALEGAVSRYELRPDVFGEMTV
jgi:DNA-binding transcriptional regulator YdaS (Cro superfamily)